MKRLVIETPEHGQEVLAEIGRKFKKRINASPLGLCPVDMLLNYLLLFVNYSVIVIKRLILLIKHTFALAQDITRISITIA